MVSLPVPPSVQLGELIWSNTACSSSRAVSSSCSSRSVLNVTPMSMNLTLLIGGNVHLAHLISQALRLLDLKIKYGDRAILAKEIILFFPDSMNFAFSRVVSRSYLSMFDAVSAAATKRCQFISASKVSLSAPSSSLRFPSSGIPSASSSLHLLGLNLPSGLMSL